ncbi:MAG: peptidylprolyl isomerase [Longimicrobiales bacterium]|nr:peptidylprolyl isomerase [Longimicrobiales bacterium]
MRRTIRPRWRPPLAALLAAVGVAACGQNAALYDPSPAVLDAQAPDSFLVEIQTSEGPFHVKLRRHWSPEGVDRVHTLMANDFYAGARIYRVVDGFVAQWGYSGDPVRDSVWREHPIPDEPTVGSNLRGVVSFARGGPESRSFQLFVNLVDNQRLDDLMSGGVEGYPPLGEIVSGLEVVDGFYSAYQDRTPSQDSIRILGNDYLRREYPQLDSIVGTRILTRWE